MSLPASTGRLCAITALVTVFWPSFSSVVHFIVFRTLIGRLKLFQPLEVLFIHNDYSQEGRAFVLERRSVVRERAASAPGGLSRRCFLEVRFSNFLCVLNVKLCSTLAFHVPQVVLLGRRAGGCSAIFGGACVSRFFGRFGLVREFLRFSADGVPGQDDGRLRRIPGILFFLPIVIIKRLWENGTFFEAYFGAKPVLFD